MAQEEHPGTEMRIVAICGSLRTQSCTRLTLEIALEGAREVGASTHLIDLREYDLGFCDGRKNEVTYPDDVGRLRDEVRAAPGIILGTPEYHGGYSGVLKNALDLMGFEEFEGKMIGLVGVAGGSLGATNALGGLRTVGRTLHAWIVPEQVMIARASQAFDESGRLKDPVLEERVREVGRQVARFAYLHTSDRIREFVRAWEGAPTVRPS